MKTRQDVRCPHCGRVSKIRGTSDYYQCPQCSHELKVCRDQYGSIYLAFPNGDNGENGISDAEPIFIQQKTLYDKKLLCISCSSPHIIRGAGILNNSRFKCLKCGRENALFINSDNVPVFCLPTGDTLPLEQNLQSILEIDPAAPEKYDPQGFEHEAEQKNGVFRKPANIFIRWFRQLLSSIGKYKKPDTTVIWLTSTATLIFFVAFFWFFYKPLGHGDGVLSGTVLDYRSGEVIQSANIEIMGREVLTNEFGEFNFTKLPWCENCVVTARHNDYGGNSVPVELSDNSLEVRILLQPVHVRKTFSSDSRILLADSYGRNLVDIPNNSLVQKGGGSVNGNVHASLTIIDPSEDIRLMPGNLTTRNSDGSYAPIESYGAITVELWDDSNEYLDLSAGAVANIAIPVPKNISSFDSNMPLYFFNESLGHWVEEGVASLHQVSGSTYYVGEVSHFSTWNADSRYETVSVFGCVADLEGNRVSGVDVIATGHDYNAETRDTTDYEGNFEVKVKPDSVVLINGKKYYRDGATNTVRLGVGSEDKEMNECLIISDTAITIKLTWNDQVKDLDSHFLGNGVNINFRNQGSLHEEPFAKLDVDDTDKHGPEIITIFKLEPGVYSYFVRNYSGEKSIGYSDALVELNVNGQIYNYRVNSNSDEKDWHPFKISVASDNSVTVQ